MNWSETQVAKLEEMCFAGVSNSDIAAELNCKVTDVYSKRSQLGITIDKVRAAQPIKGIKPNADFEMRLPNKHINDFSFADSDHEKRYQEFVAICQPNHGEKDFAAAIFLLSSPLLSRKGDAAKHVKTGQIQFSQLMKKIGPWSGSEKAMVKLAAAMYNSVWKVDVNEAFRRLDDGNVKLALEALRIRWE